jgi:hypothetical protein
MPVRTKLSAHHDPTPPTPKIITRFWAMRSIASIPKSSSERLNIALSIAIITLFSCAKVLLLPQKYPKNNVKMPKYHTRGIWNAP